ncbi:hypothetical protein ABPG75_012268 [Micractinium tetrahymenae]
MRPSAQHGGQTPRGEAASSSAAASRRATGERPATAAATYRIICSSEESLGDGELHVERRQGSVKAWYERGSTPRRVTREAPPAASGDKQSANGEAAALRSSFTVVVHDQAGSLGEEAAAGDAPGGGGNGCSAGGSPARGGQLCAAADEAAGVSWAANTLYDYLRGLREAEAPVEIDSEEWARRIGALRQLLHERDGEVAELQRLLEARAAELEAREGEVARQAQRIAELEARIVELEGRIRQLAQQLEGAQRAAQLAAVGTGRLPGGASGLGRHAVLQKQRVGSATAAYAVVPPPADSYFVQLPAQSYAEHQGCGFWQSLTSSVAETVQHHPRRWAAAAAATLLLLLIVLPATLVPAAKRRHQRPAFLEAPVVASVGASWVDLYVKLDRPALLSYMAFRQADLGTQVPGDSRTLLELLQQEAVKPAVVYGASAAGTSLDPAAVPQAGLQQLAAACGWAPVANASKDGSLPAARVSILSAAGASSTACAATSAAEPGRCARCPKLEDGTAYTLLLVAASTSGARLSSVAVANAVTGDSSLTVDSVDPPFADNATETSFTLHARMTTPGTLHYAVALDRLYAPWGASQVAYGQLTPSAAAVISASPSDFLGGLVAAGSVAVPAADEWVNVTVQPPCVGVLCSQSLWALQGGTAYRVFLVGADAFGTPDPAPAQLAVTTAPASSGPALLPATQPANVSAAGFGASVSQDTAGAVYYMLAAANTGVDPSGDSTPAGSWSQVSGLLPVNGSRRRLAGLELLAMAGSSSLGQQQQSVLQRRLLDNSSAAAPGSLVAPTCYPANRSCALTPSAAFAGTPGLASNFAVLASGCVQVPSAGQPLALPPFAGLQNNSLYHLLLVTEDAAVPQSHRLSPPAVYAVRTVDLSAPQLACGFPVATNITSSGFALSAMLTKPGASVFYVVVPSAAAASAPSAAEVLSGRAAGGATAAAAGNLTQWGALPWEGPPGGSPDARKLWASVGGLQSGGNYTAFLTVSADGSSPVSGAPVAKLSGILLPTTVPPTFTRLSGVNVSVDEARGTFALQLSAELDRPGQVFYSLYRNYSCIKGDPSVADIVAGNALGSGVCACDDATYCARAAAGSFAVPAQGQLTAHSVGGELSPLPFQSLRNATDTQLKCFQGGLGQATDTYNIYLVAGNALPSYTGLAPQCSSFAQAAAVATAAASGGAVDATCPAAPQLACAQSQLRPDSQTLQSGAVVAWATGASNSSGSGANASTSVFWQAPSGVATTGKPARAQLSLEGGTVPAFTYGPVFPADLRTGSGFGLQFALDKPALLIYAVFRPMPIDANGAPQAPVLIATGRVPVFDAATNATATNITACSWAPGGAMQPQSQYYVTYVARDKYGRMDGLCPGQAAGSAPRVCTDLAFTGG